MTVEFTGVAVGWTAAIITSQGWYSLKAIQECK